MNIKLLRALIIGASIGVVPVALAAGIDGLQYQKERSVQLKNGKTLTVIYSEMNGKPMAIIPMDDMHDFFARAEGHSMSD